MSIQQPARATQVISTLKNALRKGHLAHALLFEGPPYAGQEEAAGWLTKTIFCENKAGDDACDRCVSCLQAGQALHPDLVVLEPDGSSGIIKIEAIRELIGRASLSPLRADQKVFIIRRAECMNDVSQNALLKTLEEPLGKTLFILISSSPASLLQTIRSRCQTIHFDPSADSSIADIELEAVKNEALGYVLKKKSERSVTAMPDLAKMERESIAEILDHLIRYFRDALLIRCGAGEILGPGKDVEEKRTLAQRFSAAGLEAAIETISETKEKILNRINARIALTNLWDRLE